MELHQLIAFVRVAHEANLTHAARTLHISQSALSTQIRGLEESLGLTLFVREARGMRLTPHGETLLRKARHVLRAANALTDTAAHLRTEPSGSITVGLNTDPLFLRLRMLDDAMNARAPRVQLEFTPSQSNTTPVMLRTGQLDAGFRFGFSKEVEVEETWLADIPVVVAIPTRFLATGNNAPITWQWLAKLPWLWSSTACPYHILVTERMAKHGVAPHPVADGLDEGIVREMVANGKGVSTLRRDIAEQLEAEGLAVLWNNAEEGPMHIPLVFTRLLRRQREPALTVLRREAQALWAAPDPGSG